MTDDLEWDEQVLGIVTDTVTSAEFYLQILAIAITLAISWLLARALRRRLSLPEGEAPTTKAGRIRERFTTITYHVRDLLFPAMSAMMLGVAVAVTGGFFEHRWLVQFVQGCNFLALFYIIGTRVTQSDYVKYFMIGVLGPIAVLYGIGLLGAVIETLDGVVFELGSIRFSLYAAARTIVFGAILFWLGRASNVTAQELIRSRPTLDNTTAELILKSFQIALFVGIFLILLQVAGIDLTALVVFGGAIGVGLGFGLQQIASNFISGIIILLDRSITIGDYIELEDGRAGRLRELSMRSAVLETYDGKDIMVPNERFITTAFTNWTHNNTKQRYPITFEVAYGTDLDKLFPILREVVSSHPFVLSGPDVPIEERPDAEIKAFNDSGIEILVEFWMEAIDDGKYRVGGDLMLMIYTALRENGVEIPFPQRVVTMRGEEPGPPAGP